MRTCQDRAVNCFLHICGVGSGKTSSNRGSCKVLLEISAGVGAQCV